MRIEELDKNLKVETKINKDDIIWLSPKEAPFVIYGLCGNGSDLPYHRVPKDVAEKTSEGVKNLAWHTAGGRVRFATDSPYIAIKAVMPKTATMVHMTKAGQSGFDLYEDVDGAPAYYSTFMPISGVTDGYESLAEMKNPRMTTYSINMPLYDGVNELYIGLKQGSQIAAPRKYKHEKPVLYYGSSITQGGCASRPGNSYQAMIERMLDTDYINLGFSGNAKGEEVMVNYLASLDVSVFVCDYDHNAPNVEHLSKTHLPLYRAYREANPKTPIVFVTRPDFYRYSQSADSPDRRKVVYDTYMTAKNEGDENVYFIDGETLFEGPLRDSCTVDGCHPNDLGFFRMAQVIGKVIKNIID